MERATIWTALALLSLTSIFGACGCESKREQSLRTIYAGDRDRADEPESASLVDPALRGVELARLPHPPSVESLRAPPDTVPMMRVVLTPSAVLLDDSQLTSFVSPRLPVPEEGEEHLSPFDLPLEARTHELSWPEESVGYQFTALRDRAAELRQASLRYLGSESMAAWIELSEDDQELLDRSAYVFVDRSLPYQKVAMAMYSLGSAGIADITIRVDSADGPVRLPIILPTLCDDFSEAPAPCTYLVFTSVAAGLHATAWAAAESQDGCIAMADAAQGTTQSPSWQGQQLLGEGGSCPPVRRGERGIDPASVRRLLEAAAALGPGCPSVSVLGPPDQAWQPVAEAVALLLESERKVALGADTEFSRMVLDEAWHRCEGGLRPGG